MTSPTLQFSLPLLPLSLCQRCYAVWLNGETFEVVVSELAALFSFVCLCLALPLSHTHCRGRLWFMYSLWGPPLISCNTAFISIPWPAIASIFSLSDCLTSCSFSLCPFWLHSLAFALLLRPLYLSAFPAFSPLPFSSSFEEDWWRLAPLIFTIIIIAF